MPDDVRYPPLFGSSMREPPSNPLAEQALLGALLHNNKALDRVSSFLRQEHFADPLHGWLFAEIVKRVNAGRLVDAVALKVDLQNAAQWELHQQDSSYLASLLGAMVGIMNAGEYGQAIHDAWLRREAISIGEALVDRGLGSDPDTDGRGAVAAAIEELLKLGEQADVRAAVDFGDALSAAIAHADAAQKGQPGHRRLDTGIPAVDAIWRGMWPGELYYLMARSRTGKTPAMMQFARHVAAQLLVEAPAGEPPGCVHVFSLEMPATGIATLGLAATTRWDADQIKNGEIGGDKDWHDLHQAGNRLAQLPIVVDDQPEMDIGALTVRARAMARRRRTRLICIDFRELVRRPREHAKMALPEWIPFLGYQLKALSKAANVPVLALAQINKSRDSQDSTRPTLNDLPYDGGQAADCVFALHRPELAMGDEPPRPATVLSAEKQAALDDAWRKQRESVRGITEFIALKRRGGPTGSCRLRFDGPRQMLREIVTSSDLPDLLEAPPPVSEADYGE